MSRSACFISSIDSARVCSARRSYPQLSIILAWMKYWLIAVSSAVRTSFRQLDDARIPLHPGRPYRRPSGRCGIKGGHTAVEERLDRREASAASRAGATVVGHRRPP